MTEESVIQTRIHATDTYTAKPVQTGKKPAIQERHEGYRLIWHASLARAHWPRDATHLRTMCSSTRSTNSMPSETAAVLVFKKRTQFKVNFVSLSKSQDRASQQNLTFAGSMAATSMVQKDLALPELCKANAASSAINI